MLTLLAPPGGTTASIDLGEHGPGAGDEFVTTDSPLQRPRSHPRVGRIDHIAVVTSETRSSLSFTAQLPNGTLQVQGAPATRTTRGFTLPIVGGTGAYLGARGAVTLDTSGSIPTLTFVTRA